MVKVNISKDISGRIVVSFTYDPLLFSKIKTIDGRRWHPVEKHWSFQKIEGMLEKILKVFVNENVKIDPSLKGTVPDLQTTYPYPPHRWGREREGVKKLESGLSPKFAFEDLRRELVSRKYSYKTVKGYIYYNGAIRNELAKMP
jgi:hypothetical protein